MPEYKVLTYSQSRGEEQNMEVHMYGFGIKLLDRRKTGSDEVEHLVEAPDDDTFLDWWFDNAALDRWAAKDYYGDSSGRPKRFSSIREFGQAYIDRVKKLAEDFAYDLGIGGFIIKQDGRDELVITSDDKIGIAYFLEEFQEEQGIYCTKENNGYSVRIYPGRHA